MKDVSGLHQSDSSEDDKQRADSSYVERQHIIVDEVGIVLRDRRTTIMISVLD